MQFQQGSTQAFDGFAGCGQSSRFTAVAGDSRPLSKHTGRHRISANCELCALMRKWCLTVRAPGI